MSGVPPSDSATVGEIELTDAWYVYDAPLRAYCCPFIESSTPTLPAECTADEHSSCASSTYRASTAANAPPNAQRSEYASRKLPPSTLTRRRRLPQTTTCASTHTRKTHTHVRARACGLAQRLCHLLPPRVCSSLRRALPEQRNFHILGTCKQMTRNSHTSIGMSEQHVVSNTNVPQAIKGARPCALLRTHARTQASARSHAARAPLRGRESWTAGEVWGKILVNASRSLPDWEAPAWMCPGVANVWRLGG